MPSLDPVDLLCVLAKLNVRAALKNPYGPARDHACRNLRAMLKLSSGRLRHELQETVYREHRKTLKTNAPDSIPHAAEVRGSATDAT